jgi:hypothetical protein
MDARSVMEQRIQSMVCCFSMIQQIFQKQSDGISLPLQTLKSTESIEKIWSMLVQIPDLIDKYLKIEPKWKKNKLNKKSVEEVLNSTLEESESKINKGLQNTSVSKIACVLEDIRKSLQERPLNFSSLKNLIIEIREKLKPIEQFSTNRARFGFNFLSYLIIKIANVG